ncbi:MAG: hypothetical protein NZM29_03800 [Nitrospira sp.]|nr:hypothetical protein [Nitrospira sp.]
MCGSAPILWLLIGWTVCDHTVGWAETIRFNAYELESQEAAWTPQEVLIQRSDETEEELIFILDNPTNRTHVFEAPGLLEQIEGQNMGPLTRPLRVTIAPGETMEVVVRFAPVEGEREPSCPTGSTCYRYYCPLHRGDNDVGGLIRLIH